MSIVVQLWLPASGAQSLKWDHGSADAAWMSQLSPAVPGHRRRNCPSWVSLPTTAQTASIILARGRKHSSPSDEMCRVFDERPYELMSNPSMEHCLWDFWKSQKTDQERPLGWWDRPSWWASFPCVLYVRAELVTVARSQVRSSTVSFSLSIREVNHRQADKMTVL